MLSAKFLEAHSKRKHGAIYRFGERALGWLSSEYERGLRWVLRHQALILLVTILTFVLNVYLFILVPKGFFPEQDTGRIGGQIRGQQDVSFATLNPKVIQQANIVGADDGVANVLASASGTATPRMRSCSDCANRLAVFPVCSFTCSHFRTCASAAVTPRRSTSTHSPPTTLRI